MRAYSFYIHLSIPYRQEDVLPSIKSEVKIYLICQHRDSGIYSGKREGRMLSLKLWGIHHMLLQQLEGEEASPTGMGINFWIPYTTWTIQSMEFSRPGYWSE